MATAEQYGQWIVDNQDKQGTPEFETVAQAYKVARGGGAAAAPQPSTAESVAANPITRFALGAASPVLGAAQLLANVSPVSRMMGGHTKINEHLAQLEEMKKRGGAEGMDVAGVLGSVANPAGWMAAARLPQAASMAGRVGQGAAFGAGYGATTPVTQGDFATEKAVQTGAGAAIGGAASAIIPPAIQAGISVVKGIGGTIRDVADLWREGGAMRIFERYQNRILGSNPQDRQAIIKALTDADEFVKGSKPTAAEAVADVPAGSPLVAYQAMTAAQKGGPSAEFGKRALEQEQARASSLGTIAKDEPTRKTAEATRDYLAEINYGQAYQKMIRATPELAQLSKDPFYQKALPDAVELAKSKGISPKEDLTQFLHYVKIGLDRQLMASGDNALTNTQKNAIMGVKERLLDWLQKHNSAYDFARKEFAAQSKELDRMGLGRVLEEKLVSATEKETPASFAQAVRNAPMTIKKATGEPRYTELSQVITPDEVKTVNAVLADVVRKSKTMHQPQRTNLAGGINVAEETTPRLPQMLSRPAMIANAILRGREAKIEGQIDEIATKMYLTPIELARLLKVLPTTARNNLAQRVIDSRNPIVIGAPISLIQQGQQP